MHNKWLITTASIDGVNKFLNRQGDCVVNKKPNIELGVQLSPANFKTNALADQSLMR